MGISVFGPLQVDGDGVLEPRDRIALSVLAARRGHVVTPDQFAEALWRERPPPTWLKQVQICVGRLRKVLGAGAIETTSSGYRLAVDINDVDVHRFEQLVERARSLTTAGQAERAATAYARALSLWRGSPLDELDGWLPGRSEAARLEELRRTAQEDWLESRMTAGEHRDAAIEAEALVTTEPLRERRWAILAKAQYRCGRQGDALRTLARARRTLAEQLGIDPGEELVALERAILAQDPSLAGAPQLAPLSGACPYKGLAPYDIDDTENFFGRDADVAQCLERLRSTPLLVVAGPSGCGKSSLVRAGLVAALRGGGRDVAVFVPGRDPEAALAEAFSLADDDAVLVVDQFEEVFALGSPPEVVRRFCQRIGDHAGNLSPVVIVVRSDHLGGLGIEPTFSRLAERGLHLVTALEGDALRAAIEQPAHLAGLRIEHGLVELLMRDCDGEPGRLPLLSHALVETWRRRDGPVLTVEGYQATGGIRGAVARSADRLYDALPVDERIVLRSVLLRLIAPSAEGEPIRTRVPSRILLGDPVRERVVALLVRSRLVTSEQDTIEVAHEALARAWPRLRSWLDDDAAGQRTLRHLAAAADGWDSLGRPDSELYRGARLETALEWRDAHRPDLTATETLFLEASGHHAASESRALAERGQRDARQNRRLRGLLVATAMLLAASIVVGLVAIDQRGQARRESLISATRELTAESTANLSVDSERSVLLALAAVDQSGSATDAVRQEAEEALHAAVIASRIEQRVTGVGGALDWSPDGVHFVTEGPGGSGTVDIRDARNGESVRTFDGHEGDVTDVAFNHDGSLLATTGLDSVVRVWNPATGKQLHAMNGPAGSGVWGPSFSADGSRVAAAWPDENGGVVRVLDLSTGVVREIRAVAGANDTSFDPTGGRLAVSSASEPIAVVVDVASGDDVLTLAGHLHALNDVAWSPDGTTIATAGEDASARLFDAGTGDERSSLLGHTSHVRALDWSPDSTRLVTASTDGTAKVWSLVEGDGREMANLSEQESRNGIDGVAFSPDGTRVMTGASSGRTTIVWDVGITGGTEVTGLPSAAFHYGAAEFTADGQHLVATGGAGSLRIWDARTFTNVWALGAPTNASALPSGVPGVPVGSHDDILRVAADPTGRLVAASRLVASHLRDQGGRVEVWDVESGREAFTVTAGDWIESLAWSPGGDYLAIAGGEGDRGAVTIVDRSGREVASHRFADVFISSTAFEADGDRLVTAQEALGRYEPGAGRITIWDWRTGEIVRSIGTGTWFAVASPTGRLLASAPHPQGGSQSVEIWDSTTGELVSTLTGHTGPVRGVAFSPDGSRLATVDGTIRLWDPSSGEQLLELRDPFGAASTVSFSADGSKLATSGPDGVVRIWALDPDELIAIAERRLTRTPTDDECSRYFRTTRCR